MRMNPDTADTVDRSQELGMQQWCVWINMTHKSKKRLPTVPIKEITPPRQDLETALDLFDYCLKSQDIDPINLRTLFGDVVKTLKSHLDLKSSRKGIKGESPAAQLIQRRTYERQCYISQYLLLSHHRQ